MKDENFEFLREPEMGWSRRLNEISAPSVYPFGDVERVCMDNDLYCMCGWFCSG